MSSSSRETTIYSKFSSTNIYLLIEIKHNILIECHLNYIEMIKFNYMLENDIFWNSSQFFLGGQRGDFLGLGCLNDAQMPWWLLAYVWKYQPFKRLIACHILCSLCICGLCLNKGRESVSKYNQNTWLSTGWGFNCHSFTNLSIISFRSA